MVFYVYHIYIYTHTYICISDKPNRCSEFKSIKNNYQTYESNYTTKQTKEFYKKNIYMYINKYEKIKQRKEKRICRHKIRNMLRYIFVDDLRHTQIIFNTLKKFEVYRVTMYSQAIFRDVKNFHMSLRVILRQHASVLYC